MSSSGQVIKCSPLRFTYIHEWQCTHSLITSLNNQLFIHRFHMRLAGGTFSLGAFVVFILINVYSSHGATPEGPESSSPAQTNR